jgi:O-antigen ligase
MLVGGGGNRLSEAVVQLVALPLLAWALFKLNPSQLGRGGQWAIALLCVILALPLLQLVPLPPSLWSDLPGRREFAEAYEVAGMAPPWLPLSLDPSATWLGLLSLLPAIAIFLAILSLDPRSRRILIVLIFIIIFASVLLGVLQIMGGDASNRGRAAGLFTDPDHNAAFLYSGIPLAAAWAIGLVREHRRHRVIGLTFLALLLVTIILGVAASQSRAGMALLFVAGLCSLVLAWRHERDQSGHRDQAGRRLLRFAIGAYLVVLLLAFQFGFVALTQRFEALGLQDRRWPVAEVTYQAAIANLPFGSGFGSFIPVYDKFAPRTLLGDTYVNQAHDDWLELWLTGGAPAILLILGFLAWFAASTVRLWRSGQPDAPVLDLALAQAASIVIVLLLLHSVVDFPLRILAISVLFAVACAFLIPRRGTEHSAETSASLARSGPENTLWSRNR